MTRQAWPIQCAIAGFATAIAIYAGLLAVGQVRREWAAAQPTVVLAANIEAAMAKAAATVPPAVPAAAVLSPEQRYYDGLRANVRYVRTRLGDAPDYESRIALAKSAAQRAGLAEVGLTWRDVYGVINAETSWAARAGAGLAGTPSYGVAQFEPATARALGVRDPNDVVEAVHAAARHMKEAALWSRERIARLQFGAQERAEKVREGVSVYYNLSSKARAQWNGLTAASLPVPTQRHIANVRFGAQEAAFLDAQMRASEYAQGNAVATAAAATAQPR
jgi:hypothetical protein